jgi:hypothetical protein
MDASKVVNFQLRRAREVGDAATVIGGALGPCGVTPSREEKDYQRLVSEKLKAAADWDFRDSKQLKIG